MFLKNTFFAYEFKDSDEKWLLFCKKDGLPHKLVLKYISSLIFLLCKMNVIGSYSLLTD